MGTPLDQKAAAILKLQVALGQAPRPSPKPNAEWVIAYMDWFFQMRISALDETRSAQKPDVTAAMGT